VGDVEDLGDGLILLHIQPLKEADYASELGVSRHQRAEDENRLKSLAADRVIPVHPVLLRLGFARYVKLRGGARSDFLFDDITTAELGGRNLSRSFLDLRRLLDITRLTVDFHSFRHTARTTLKALGADRDHLDLIFGHENGADRDHVREIYTKGYWYRPAAASLAKLTYGIPAFGEDPAALDQMRRDGFVLSR
jgi:integrase